MTHPIPILTTLAAVAAAMAFAAPAAAANTQGWDVTATGKTCTMLSTFEDDMSVGLVLTGPDAEVAFIAAGDDLEKIAGKAGATVPLNVTFDGQVPHNDWTDEAARVVSVGTHRVAVVSGWGPELSKELADTVASSSKVSIGIAGKDVGSYDLAGSRAASEELMRCGTQIASK